MEFNKFCKALGFKNTESTEIGKLFGLAPQVVHNWKLRNSVPPKHVLKAQEMGLIDPTKAA